MKRIFVAVKTEAGEDLLRMISSLKTSLSEESIKWVDPGNIHLTLAFLGDTEEKRIRIITSLLKDKISGFGEFDFTLAGTGVFKNFRDPRIVWAGIRSTERLIYLQNTISTALKETGFYIEERSFNPHLTLGRIRYLKDPENLKTALERYSETEFQTIQVREVILFESILTQKGSIYKPLGNFTM
jgi:2'-5' RNA ligase